jgi:hypothetical protein
MNPMSRSVHLRPSTIPRVPGEGHSGGCLCGGVRYEVSGPLRDVVLCHCGRCRRTHGHVAAYAACEEADLAMPESGTLRWYVQDGRSRGFCGACGASLFWHADGHPTVSIAAGTLDRPTGLRTIAQVYIEDRGDYYGLSDEGERFPGSRFA